MAIGQMIICSGCCGGVFSRGESEVPAQLLKQEWRARGLLKKVQFTISCCLGPCDLTNVVKVHGPNFEVWLGKIRQFGQYANLLEWVELYTPRAPFDPFRHSPFERTINDGTTR